MTEDRQVPRTIWRLVPQSEDARQLLHVPAYWNSHIPKCSLEGEYRLVHQNHPDVEDKTDCPGCFEGVDMHDLQTENDTHD